MTFLFLCIHGVLLQNPWHYVINYYILLFLCNNNYIVIWHFFVIIIILLHSTFVHHSVYITCLFVCISFYHFIFMPEKRSCWSRWSICHKGGCLFHMIYKMGIPKFLCKIGSFSYAFHMFGAMPHPYILFCFCIQKVLKFL